VPGPPAPSRAETLAAVEAALSGRFARVPAKASVSFVGVEQLHVLRFDDPAAGDQTFVTLGMSGAPMTAAQDLVQSADGPRAELVLTVHPGWDDVWRPLAVLAAAPAVEGVVYSAGSSIDTGAALAAGSRCTGALIVESALADIPWAGSSVRLLALLPATANELAWCRVHGADALRQRWSTQAVDLQDLGRAQVLLD
jgi:Suppressor of fused protein (SUFU)